MLYNFLFRGFQLCVVGVPIELSMAKVDCDTWSDEDVAPSGKRRAEGITSGSSSPVAFKRPRPCVELRISNQTSTLSTPSAEDSDADTSEAPRSKPSTLAVDR